MLFMGVKGQVVQECKKTQDRQNERWINGTGTTIIGTALMLIVLAIVLSCAQLFITQVASHDAQTAADSIADGVATYMSDNGGDFEDAKAQAKVLRKYIEDNTPTNIKDVTLNKKVFDDNQIEATVTVYARSLSGTGGTYTVTRSTTTEFKKLFSSLVEWMIEVAADDTHGYSQERREFNPDIDCSSFVYYALLNNGFSVAQLGGETWWTGNMGGILVRNGFKELSYASERGSLQAGDILWRVGHTEVYVGNGQTVGAHGCHSNTRHPGRSPSPGDQDGTEVSVATNAGGWSKVYRL